jgi:transposase InsO family protein
MRVDRLMRKHGLRSVRSPPKRRYKSGKPAVVAPNRLQRQFTVDQPDRSGVTDITYLRTAEGWLYLAVVIDLYSRAVIGWSMKSTLARELALDALLMAIWRRRPTGEVIIHSDQGVQYGSDDWRRLCREHGLEVSMSRRGNCWDNSVAESFFSSLKKERIRGRVRRPPYLSSSPVSSSIPHEKEIERSRYRRRGSHRLAGGDGALLDRYRTKPVAPPRTLWQSQQRLHRHKLILLALPYLSLGIEQSRQKPRHIGMNRELMSHAVVRYRGGHALEIQDIPKDPKFLSPVIRRAC